MNVVWHENVGVEVVVFAVKVVKARFNTVSDVATTQAASPRAAVKPLVMPAREALVIFSFLSGRPRFRVLAQPHCALGLPLSLEVQRNGITESECDEISCTSLCPMRQVALCNSEVSPRIKAAKEYAPRIRNADTLVRAVADSAGSVQRISHGS